MNAKVADLMVTNVITASRHKTVEHARGVMDRNKIQCLPVVDPEGTAAGILTSSDLVSGAKDAAKVSSVMT